MELLIIISIIVYMVKFIKKNAGGNSSTASGRQAPPSPPKTTPPVETVQKTVNQKLYGSSVKPADKYHLYRQFIERDRYSDMEKLGHEVGLSKYQVAADLKSLQRQGYFKTITVDDKEYKLYYTSSAPYATRQAAKSKPKASPMSHSPKAGNDEDIDLELTYVQPSTAYKPALNAGKRHEEWMELPPHHQSVKCHYCGALNALPLGRRSKYTCYFCREEL